MNIYQMEYAHYKCNYYYYYYYYADSSYTKFNSWNILTESNELSAILQYFLTGISRV